MPDRIELVSGAAGWLSLAQTLLTAVAAILLLSAATPWSWKTAALLLQFTVHCLARRHVRIHQPSGRLVVQLDGSLRLQEGSTETAGTMGQGAWSSPWLCLLRWTDTGGRHRSNLVCASENRRDDYRRLLVLLRLRNWGRSEARSW